MDPDLTLLVHAAHADVVTLGPGPAAVVWVQGCDRGCRGCMSPGTFDPAAGRWVRIVDLAEWLDRTGHSFLTLSGGEPFDQAESLAALADEIRARRDWVVTAYTGHRIEALLDGARPGAAGLIERLDLLIDGPYVESLHASLLWRGSSNQRLHRLTDRVEVLPDESAGVASAVEPDGSVRFVGVPPVPSFVDDFLAVAGDRLVAHDAPPVLPFPTTRGAH